MISSERQLEYPFVLHTKQLNSVFSELNSMNSILKYSVSTYGMEYATGFHLLSYTIFEKYYFSNMLFSRLKGTFLFLMH